MIEAIKNLFIKKETDLTEFIYQGAFILDVRNKDEFSKLRIKGSVNIPLNELQNNLHMLNEKSRVIITCSESGVKSLSAKNLLKINGYSKVYNGGEWQNLYNKIKQNEHSLL